MNNEKFLIAEEVTNFLTELCQGNFNELKRKWGISDAVCEEIKERLIEYCGEDDVENRFSPPQLKSESQIHVADEDDRVSASLRLFRLENANGWATECDLLYDGEKSDLTMLADVYANSDGSYKLNFRMLEVQ